MQYLCTGSQSNAKAVSKRLSKLMTTVNVSRLWMRVHGRQLFITEYPVILKERQRWYLLTSLFNIL